MSLSQSSPHFKFRPVLTLSQIQHIIHLINLPENQADENVNLNKSLRKILVPMLSKIEVGAINPAYKLSDIHHTKQTERAERQRYENDEMSQEEMAIYEAKLLGDL